MCFLFAEVWHVTSLSHWTSPTLLEPWCESHRPRIVGRCVCFFFKDTAFIYSLVYEEYVFRFDWLFLRGAWNYHVFSIFHELVILCGDRGDPWSTNFQPVRSANQVMLTLGRLEGTFELAKKKEKLRSPRAVGILCWVFLNAYATA